MTDPDHVKATQRARQWAEHAEWNFHKASIAADTPDADRPKYRSDLHMCADMSRAWAQIAYMEFMQVRDDRSNQT